MPTIVVKSENKITVHGVVYWNWFHFENTQITLLGKIFRIYCMVCCRGSELGWIFSTESVPKTPMYSKSSCLKIADLKSR